MAYFVAILTPDSARPCVMQSTLPTKGMRSIISTVSICLKDFLSSILLLMVIIVLVVIVTVIWVVIFVDVIVGVVIAVASVGVVVVVRIIGIVVVVGVPSIIKLSFVIIGFLHRITLYYLVHYPPMKASIKDRLHFLTFFNDPRIIWEQRIAAFWVEKRRDVVRVDDVVELEVSKKNNVSTSGNKKKDVEPTKETATLADDEGIPLTRVDPSGKHDSDDEVASVDNDMANFLAPKDVSYGTNSLLEQWKESYRNREYDYDPYDDDMYEG
ncbi:hypothetical protein Tco_0340257 [Tanacetum coccineum]